MDKKEYIESQEYLDKLDELQYELEEFESWETGEGNIFADGVRKEIEELKKTRPVKNIISENQEDIEDLIK